MIPPLGLERAYGAALRDLTTPLIRHYQIPILVWASGRLRADGEPTRNDGIDDELATLIKQLAESLRPVAVADLATTFGRRVGDHAAVQLRRQIKAGLGIDLITNDPKQENRVKIFATANANLVRTLHDSHAGRVAGITFDAVQKGRTYRQLAADLDAAGAVTKRRAIFIARDQIGSIYGQINAERQKDLGITHFTWRTSHDERVRPEHRELDGERFAYDDLPSEGLPGEPVLCRCYAEPDFSAVLDP